VAGFCRRAGQGSCPFTVRRLSLRAILAAGAGLGRPSRVRASEPPRSALRIDSSGSRASNEALVLDAQSFPRLPAAASADCPPPAIADFLRQAGEVPGESFRATGADPRAALFPCPRWQLPDVSARYATGPQPESN